MSPTCMDDGYLFLKTGSGHISPHRYKVLGYPPEISDFSSGSGSYNLSTEYSPAPGSKSIEGLMGCSPMRISK